MKKIWLLIMTCLLILCMPIAYAEEGFNKEYGSALIINAPEGLPDIPVMDSRTIVKPSMVAEEVINAKYEVEKVKEERDSSTNKLYQRYESDELMVINIGDGNYTYIDNDKRSLEMMLTSYVCIDAYNNFAPDGDWMVDQSEFGFMSAAEACALVENEFKELMPDAYSSFDIELIAHPAHAADMQKKVKEVLKEECKTQEDLDFYERKYHLYEGCIADNDDYYFIEGRWRFDGVPMLRGEMAFSHDLYVSGSRLWAIVGKEGITYLGIDNAMHVTQQEPREPISRTSDEVLTKVGKFMDNLLGMEPYNIDKVELIYVPYPTAMFEYEMTPVLVLSEYDAEADIYRPMLRVNVLTYELVF